MKARKHIRTVIGELIANLVSWVAGLLAVELLSGFLAIRSWKNGWGMFTRKATVDAETFSLLQWILAAVVGFLVMLLVNKLITKLILDKIHREEEKKIEPSVNQ